MDGNLYSFDEAEPLVRNLARSLIGKFKRFREDIIQSALTAAWECTKDGPADFDVITVAVKRSVARTIGDLCGRKAADDVDRDAFSDVAYDEQDDYLDSEIRKWGVRRRNSLAGYDELPLKSKQFLKLFYYRKFSFKEAVRCTRISGSEAKRLVLRYNELIDTLRREYLSDTSP
jgi:hypothetical protein